jgi:hypothetical protein
MASTSSALTISSFYKPVFAQSSSFSRHADSQKPAHFFSIETWTSYVDSQHRRVRESNSSKNESICCRHQNGHLCQLNPRLPPFIRMQDIEVNMTNLLSQSTPDVPPSPRSKAAAMHFDLLRMTVLSRDSVFPIQSDQEEDYVDPQHLVDIEKKLRTCSHAVPGLASESVAEITCSTKEAKSAPLVCFHHRSSFERVVPNPRACWTIASSFA